VLPARCRSAWAESPRLPVPPARVRDRQAPCAGLVTAGLVTAGLVTGGAQAFTRAASGSYSGRV
jgi:hypothetical protein